jgi:hypothetical protein
MNPLEGILFYPNLYSYQLGRILSNMPVRCNGKNYQIYLLEKTMR